MDGELNSRSFNQALACQERGRRSSLHSRIARPSAKASAQAHIQPVLIGILCVILSWSTATRAERTDDEDQVAALYQSGQEQLKVHHFEEAQAYFKKALEMEPSHCASFMGLLHAYLFLEDLGGVRQLLPQSLSLEGCSDADQDYLQAIREELSGNWNEALDRYRAIVQRDPSDPRPLVYMALIHLGLKEYTPGIEACQRAIKADPNFSLAHNVLGRLALAKGDLMGATAEFEKALEIFPDYPLGHASLGDAYLKQEMEDKARTQFQEAERLDPENADLLALIGNTFLDAGKKEDAVHCYEKSLRINPDNPMIHYFLARIYLQEGRHEKVDEEVEAVLRCAPYLQEIYREFGNMYLEQSELDQAEKYFQRQIKITPDDLQARNALSWVYFIRGDYDLAEAQAQEMIRINPQLVNGYNNLGYVLIEKGMFGSAIEQFRKGIATSGDVPELHAGLARAFFRKGQLEDAKLAAEEALKLQPDAPEAHLILGLIFTKQGVFDQARAEAEFLSKTEGGEHLSLFLEGQIALEKGELEKAVEAFRKARASFPAMSVEFLRAEALAHLQGGAVDQAVEASQEALEINPNFALSYRDLGLAFRAKGKDQEARKALQRFLELWGGAEEDNPDIKGARRVLQELES